MGIRTSYSKGNNANLTNGSLDVNAGNLDNAGRLEVSNAIATGEYTLDNDAKPLLIDTNASGGTSSATYDATLNGITLFTDNTALARAELQTKQFHPYFPGHAQQPEFTFIGFGLETNTIKRIGYYNDYAASGTDGIYLESNGITSEIALIAKNSVTLVSHKIPIENWLDPLDGSGPSGITIDWDNFQVFLIDFLYLGGTYVNLYYIAEGKRHLVHRFNHSNSFPNVIISTPAQPLMAQVLNHVSGSNGGSFTFVCGQVSTMGVNGRFSGLPFSINTGTSVVGCSSAGTEYAIIGIKKTLPNIEQFLSNVNITSSAGTGESYLWKLHINPTVTGTFTYSAVPDHYLERALGAGSATIGGGDEGYILAGGTGTSRSQQTSLDISNAIRIGVSIAEVYDELVLTYTPLQANQNMTATISGIMI